MTPGLKFSTTMSIAGISSITTARPSSVDVSMQRLFLPRFCWMKPPERRSRRGWLARIGSPCGGTSTLMTSAPISASSRVHAGPARYCVKSSTRYPAR